MDYFILASISTHPIPPPSMRHSWIYWLFNDIDWSSRLSKQKLRIKADNNFANSFFSFLLSFRERKSITIIQQRSQASSEVKQLLMINNLTSTDLFVHGKLNNSPVRNCACTFDTNVFFSSLYTCCCHGKGKTATKMNMRVAFYTTKSLTFRF